MTPDATARPLILLHGALGTSAQLDPLAERLRAASLAVHALDFEGHGLGAPGGRPYRIEHFAGNVLEALERLRHAPPPCLFGYSMGGYVGLHLARHLPDRVAGVFTLGTRPWWTADVAEREVAQLDPDTIRAKVPRFAALLEARHGAAGWPAVLGRTAEMMRALGDRPPLGEADFAAIETRVRIGVGDRDATVSVEESARLARLVPDAELEVFPRTPHPIERVSWDRLARSVQEFAAALPV
jgi:pimeloyl-ACP methyl ester carboxylesterase